MKALTNNIAIEEENILSRIYLIRGKQVMLSHDLAQLYTVETKVLNQQVKRNNDRFPERYCFQLEKEEYERLRSQFVTLKRGQHLKYLPYAFTEHGILMLSSVLHSISAEKVSILIIDAFVKLRDLMFVQKDLLYQVETIQNKLRDHDNQILTVLEYLRQRENANQGQSEYSNRPRIGFRTEY